MGIIIFFFVSVVLDRMTQLSVEERIETFFAKDWKAEAEKVIGTDSTLKPLPQVMFFSAPSCWDIYEWLNQILLI